VYADESDGPVTKSDKESRSDRAQKLDPAALTSSAACRADIEIEHPAAVNVGLGGTERGSTDLSSRRIHTALSPPLPAAIHSNNPPNDRHS